MERLSEGFIAMRFSVPNEEYSRSLVRSGFSELLRF